MKKKLVVAFVLILLVGGGIFLKMKQPTAPVKTVDALSSTTIEKIIPQAKVSTDGWKTCRNEEYGYEFKYPKEWYLYNSEVTENVPVWSGVMTQATATDKCVGSVSVSSFIETGGPNSPPPPKGEELNYFGVEFDLHTGKATSTEEFIIWLNKITSEENLRIATGSRQTFEVISLHEIGGKRFFVLQWYDIKNKPRYRQTLLLSDDKKSLIRLHIGKDLTPFSKISKINETILSTFKFFEQGELKAGTPTTTTSYEQSHDFLIKELESVSKDSLVKISSSTRKIKICDKDFTYYPVFINNIDILERIAILDPHKESVFDICLFNPFNENGGLSRKLDLSVKRMVLTPGEQKETPRIFNGLYLFEIQRGAIFRIDVNQNKIYSIGYTDVVLGNIR